MGAKYASFEISDFMAKAVNKFFDSIPGSITNIIMHSIPSVVMPHEDPEIKGGTERAKERDMINRIILGGEGSDFDVEPGLLHLAVIYKDE